MRLWRSIRITDTPLKELLKGALFYAMHPIALALGFRQEWRVQKIPLQNTKGLGQY